MSKKIRYSIATEGENVAQHFGRCPKYTIVDTEDCQILNTETVPNPGHATGAIPKYMADLGVNVMIAGGMGRRAINFFQQYGIKTILGQTGTISEIVNQIKADDLKGGESICSPGGGKGYGIPKSDGHGE